MAGAGGRGGRAAENIPTLRPALFGGRGGSTQVGSGEGGG